MERTLIAVVDDEPVWLTTVGRALAREGYWTQLIGDGEAALDLITSERPTVVVVDRHMPAITGLELSERLQHRLGDQCPPMILVTGDLGELTRQELDRFEAVYEKPVSLQKLMRAVRRLVRGSKRSGHIRAVGAADEAPEEKLG